MVTNLNLSYPQALGLLKNHCFHPHPRLCSERWSTWPSDGSAPLGDPGWDTAPRESPEAPSSAGPRGTGTPRPPQTPLGSPRTIKSSSHAARRLSALRTPRDRALLLFYLSFLLGSLNFSR